MRPTPATILIRSFKSSTIKLYIILLAIGGQSGVDDLHILSGLSKPTIKSALDDLRYADPPLVTKVSRYKGWILTQAGQQLALPIETSQKFFDSPISSSSNLNKESNIKSIATTSGGNEKFLDSPDPDILKLLHENGIYDPKAGELAAMPHVTKEYIIAFISTSKENGGSEDLPLIIWKMTQARPAPVAAPSILDGWEPCAECGILTNDPPNCIDCENEKYGDQENGDQEI